MSFFVWTPALSVGIKIIDEEHMQWISYIDQLHQAFENGSDHKILCANIENIKNFSQEHFKHEEAMFLATNYPDAARHSQLHKKYLEELDLLSGLCSPVTAGALTMDTLLSLKKWLINHVQEVDMQYVPYIKKK